MLDHREIGNGAPVLLVHGAAEDLEMLTGQAAAIAARGRRVIWYDRRGTGGSTREDWPGGGVERHADDVAELLRTCDAAGATVLGFSSGGVIALAAKVRHPALVGAALAWEPPVLTALPDGPAIHAQLIAPMLQYLAERPADWPGAFHVMLTAISGGRADLGSAEVRRMTVNAEAAVRDDAQIITRHRFGALPDGCRVAVRAEPDPLHAAIAARLTGGRPLVVAGADDHEIYLQRPEVLAAELF